MQSFDRTSVRPTQAWDGAAAYAAAALDLACRNIRGLREGNRNNALNREAFSIGQLIAARTLTRREAEAALQAAAIAAKLDRYEAIATIRSGIDAGLRQPRDLSGIGRNIRRGSRPPKLSHSPRTATARREILPEPEESTHPAEEEAARTMALGFDLWDRAGPAKGSPVQTYLESRGIRAKLPCTLRFLPGSNHYPEHPCMIAAFGIGPEIEPGRVTIPQSCIKGFHITAIKPDGSGKADIRRKKWMLGKGSAGWPIVLRPPNDLSGLLIAEGIETVLSAWRTGLGLWAAGTGGRMIALADKVPRYIETVTIAAEEDATGQKGANELAARLASRGIEAFFTEVPEVARSSR